MPNDEKLRELAQHLLERSRQNQVHWKEMPGMDGSGFYADVATSRVLLVFEAPTGSSEQLRLSVRQARGPILAEWIVPRGNLNWFLLWDLYSEAVCSQFAYDAPEEPGKEKRTL